MEIKCGDEITDGIFTGYVIKINKNSYIILKRKFNKIQKISKNFAKKTGNFSSEIANYINKEEKI